MDRNNACRDHALRVTKASTRAMVCLILSLCVVGFPLRVLAGDEPQELLKPSHMTVAPLFQEWQFDESTLNQVPEVFPFAVAGTSHEGGWGVNEDKMAPRQPKTIEQYLTCEKNLCYQIVACRWIDRRIRRCFSSKEDAIGNTFRKSGISLWDLRCEELLCCGR